MEAEGGLEDEVSRFFSTLGHPLRRKVIQYLGDHERGGFSDLKAYVNVSTGTLYYQLDLLRGLIEQDEEKKYRLNEKGRFAYQLLRESGERLVASRYVKRNPSVVGYVTLWLIGWRLISSLYGMPKLAILSAAFILLYGAWATHLSGLYPILLVYVDYLPLPLFYAPILFILGYLLVNVLANLVSYIAYRARGGVKDLLLGSAVSLLPSIMLPTAYVAARELQAPLSSLHAQVLMLIGIGYSLCFLTSAISLSKGLSAEKAALSASVTLYASLGLAFILTNL
ncbi:MAG: winged helix-turn-helix domain-containing protein [Candidatus Bathyarchaeia archaeon]